MARWLARRMLVTKEEVSARLPLCPSVHPAKFHLQTYSDHPPLKPLISLLSPSHGSLEIFDILGNAEQAGYYEDLASYIQILNVVLNDIDGYAQIEESEKSNQPVASLMASPGQDKPLTELEQIKSSLDRLHGKISTSCSTLKLCQTLYLTSVSKPIRASSTSPAQPQRQDCSNSPCGCTTRASPPRGAREGSVRRRSV